MAKKFANILGLNNVFMYNSETNAYRIDLFVEEIKNEIDYNTICFIKSNSSDANRKIGNYIIKENDTFIVAQKEVFAINPKDGFSSNIIAGTNISITNGVISANGYTYNPSNYSFAEGFGTIASGQASHAEGAKYKSNRSTESAGQASHAEGASTYAKADGSHAEGILNVAGRFLDEIGTAAQELGISGTPKELGAKLLGYGAHVEGMNNKALGSCSHAEGQATNALANSTHAEGDTTIAFGEASHAEGYNTQAKGNQSHTEGSNTIATGNSAHAEGVSTVASGSFSHAEGSHTEATGRDSHSEGAYSKANGIASHSEGDHTTASGDYSHTEGCGYSSSVTHEIVIKEFVDDNYLNNVYEYTGIDFNYFTDYNDTILNGAEIYNPIDTNLEAPIAEIVASKYIEGYGDTMPSGTYLKIDFYNSNTFDSLTDLDGGKSALVVLRSGSYGDGSHSEGDCTISEGFASHSEGLKTLAHIDASHAEGNSTIACGSASHAEGYFNISGGEASHTEGSSNVARGAASHAEGIENKSIGDYSHTEGHFNNAYGINSHAEGIYTLAYGDASHTEGGCTKAYGIGAHAEGYYTEANGYDSHAEGYCTITNNTGEHAEGRYNLSSKSDSREEEPEHTTISSIGIGSGDGNRANAVEVMLNGDVYIKGIGDYDGTNISDAKSIQQVITSQQQLIDELVEFINNNFSGNIGTPDEEVTVNYSELYEGKTLSDESISDILPQTTEMTPLKIASVNENYDIINQTANIEIKFATPPSPTDGHKSIMFTDSTGYIYCFRDIENESYNTDTVVYNITIQWPAQNDDLGITKQDRCYLFQKTVEEYAAPGNEWTPGGDPGLVG